MTLELEKLLFFLSLKSFLSLKFTNLDQCGVIWNKITVVSSNSNAACGKKGIVQIYYEGEKRIRHF